MALPAGRTLRTSRFASGPLLCCVLLVAAAACDDDNAFDPGSGSADLQVSLLGDEEVARGEVLELQLRVRNNGPDAANDVEIGLELADGLDPLVISGGGAVDEATRTIQWPAIEVLPTDQERGFIVQLTAEESGTKSFRAFGSSATPDPVPGNNDGTDSGTLATEVVDLDLADLVVELGSTAVTTPGGSITYRVVVRNEGPDMSREVTAALTLESGQTPDEISHAGTHEQGVVRWPAAGPVAAGDSLVRTVTATAGFIGAPSARASAEAATEDPIKTNSNGSLSFSATSTTLALETLYQLDIDGSEDGRATELLTPGDLDGDGVDDIVVGIPSATVGGAAETGRTSAFSGATGSTLWRTNGSVAGASFGSSLSTDGDQDGDGVIDVMVGSPDEGTNCANSGLACDGAARLLSGADGQVLLFLKNQQSHEGFGQGLASLDDRNGDGVAELAVGAPVFGPGEQVFGAVYVMSGRDGEVVSVIEGPESGTFFGVHLTAAGDVDGDGRRELLVRSTEGLRLVSPVTGEALVGPVSVETFVDNPPPLALPDITGDGLPELYVADRDPLIIEPGPGGGMVLSGSDLSEVLSFEGEETGDLFGAGGYAGDVDGDGTPDLVVGAPGQDSGAEDAGKVYVFSGSDGALLLTHTETTPGLGLGRSAMRLSDVDGDGVDDFVVLTTAPERVVVLKGVRVE